MNGRNGRFFLDTNVVIYQFDRTAPQKAARAEALVAEAAAGRGVISYQVVQEFCNAVTRDIRRPFEVVDLETYLDTVLRALVEVEFSLELVKAGLHLASRHRVAFYDALIVASAQQARCGVLYSEDLQHGQRFGGVVIENPFL